MFKINWAKFDKFYLVAFAAIVALAVLVIFNFKSIFASILSAYEVEKPLESEQRVNKASLEEAYDFVFGKPSGATEEGEEKKE